MVLLSGSNSGPPCSVPSRRSCSHASTHQTGLQEPADDAEHPRISHLARHASTRAICTSWLTRSKNFARPTSATQLLSPLT
jgi:hypothetical protein